MQISIKKDLELKPFSKIPSGTVFRFPQNEETFYIKTRYKCKSSGIYAEIYQGMGGGINLYDGGILPIKDEEEVIPYYDAELIIQ